MPDESTNYTQQLSSAKYYYEAHQAEAGAAEPLQDQPREQPSFEGMFRWISPLVGVMLLVAVGAVTWKHRQSLADTAGVARERGSNPIDLLMWISGSDKTFKDVVTDAQRQSAAQFENMKPIDFGEGFKPFDSTQLWAPAAQEQGKWGGS